MYLVTANTMLASRADRHSEIWQIYGPAICLHATAILILLKIYLLPHRVGMCNEMG